MKGLFRMTEKTRVCVLFGGRSCEHEVSVTSARCVLEAIDQDKYDVTMIGISKEGRWLMADDALGVLQAPSSSATSSGWSRSISSSAYSRCGILGGAPP